MGGPPDGLPRKTASAYAGINVAACDINALITDIANANSTLGFYLVPAGSKKC
jgi:hypothetical protein